MVDERYIGDGKVLLLAGGGRIFTDIAARFVRSERELEDIAASPYSREIVRNILGSGHGAALEFDWFLFGVEGYSRVTEVQLVRKRHASYLIKSGRAELKGKRRFSVAWPRAAADFTAELRLPDGRPARLSGRDLAELSRQWYEAGLAEGIPEEDLRYLKPQATTFKAIIGMNAHALRDWFAIRCCRNAQAEIRDLAWKMLRLCRKAAPDLFAGAGPSCVGLGYCPENALQNPACRGRILTKEEALGILRERERANHMPSPAEFNGGEAEDGAGEV
ncbi:MAG: FAD-dependent thymidylate synthase [Desulfovibrio sp.]|uniref:FAD-dependent thymidylate synthase n=1 Tax=Desulfovibrio sp. TaxID=885 RepID=UPI001A671E5E|nr:FAD-dependent thymidylate synthase [Desulfovibrio sp.]MBD5418170.1 FAD-dependent thymidylate synthase [Desulfovibrio sp.]